MSSARTPASSNLTIQALSASRYTSVFGCQTACSQASAPGRKNACISRIRSRFMAPPALSACAGGGGLGRAGGGEGKLALARVVVHPHRLAVVYLAFQQQPRQGRLDL